MLGIEETGEVKNSLKSSLKTEDQIIALINQNNRITTEITTKALGTILGISKRAVLKQIDKLK